MYTDIGSEVYCGKQFVKTHHNMHCPILCESNTTAKHGRFSDLDIMANNFTFSGNKSTQWLFGKTEPEASLVNTAAGLFRTFT